MGEHDGDYGDDNRATALQRRRRCREFENWEPRTVCSQDNLVCRVQHHGRSVCGRGRSGWMGEDSEQMCWHLRRAVVCEDNHLLGQAHVGLEWRCSDALKYLKHTKGGLDMAIE